MPYNKGDFTQQGIAGYVNGGLLLNNKRDVTARISTDEETAGIDSVDIKIKDRLNDIEYHITGENLSEGENVIGGGGGTILPLLTVALTTNGEYLLGGDMLPIIENNLVTPGVVSTANTETVYKFLPIPREEDGNLMAGAVINSVENAIISAGWVTGTNVIVTSNEVNCTVIEPEPGYKVVLITDIYSPASITINFSHNE